MISDDLAWWRAHRDAAVDPATLREVLSRLKAWKTQHDDDRRSQPVAFLQMTWDWVFGEEAGEVADAIDQIEAGLTGAQNV